MFPAHALVSLIIPFLGTSPDWGPRVLAEGPEVAWEDSFLHYLESLPLVLVGKRQTELMLERQLVRLGDRSRPLSRAIAAQRRIFQEERTLFSTTPVRKCLYDITMPNALHSAIVHGVEGIAAIYGMLSSPQDYPSTLVDVAMRGIAAPLTIAPHYEEILRDWVTARMGLDLLTRLADLSGKTVVELTKALELS